jgi:hypothetical protein
MCLFARLAIQDANITISFIQSAGAQFKPSSPDFVGEIMDRWIDKVKTECMRLNILSYPPYFLSL